MTKKQTSWDELAKGENCYLCKPRERNNEYRREIQELAVSTLFLFTDQRFRGYCLLVFDPRHVTAIDQLTKDEYALLMNDLRRAAIAVRLALQPDHMNYESLGNTDAHLTWHIVPRYKDDPRWGQPIWEGWPRNEFNKNRFTLSEAAYRDIIDRIRFALTQTD